MLGPTDFLELFRFTTNSDPSVEDLRSNNVEITFVFFYEVAIIESV